mmetsp:Transcript_2502/g.5500  ORF Transcript_2502/g.5500 Transcript_2502/m.5500 type:complete len:297 (+) Transcript_2502:89-979(+)
MDPQHDSEVRPPPEEEEVGGTQSADQARHLQYCNIRDFLAQLSVDPRVDASSIVAAAHHMYSAPLPPHWTEHVDESTSRVYFFHQLQGEAVWSHPQEALFKELLEEVRSWRTDEDVESIISRAHAHVRKAHSAAAEETSKWTGPHDVAPEDALEAGEAAHFYYNSSTGESQWEDPRELVEFDLKQRHAILCQCVSTHAQNLSKMLQQLSSRSSSVADSELEDHTRIADVAARVQDLFSSLGKLPLPVPQDGAAVPEHVTPRQQQQQQGSKAASAPGDETSRSQMSYLTARSTTTDH